MKKPHKYAHVWKWIAEGEEVQYWSAINKDWSLLENNTTVLCNAFHGIDFQFRIKPRTIMIGDVECEAPIKELAKGEVCYLLRLPGEELQRPAQAYMHQNNIESAVNKGVMFATPEAALAAGTALSKLLTQE